VDTSTYSIIAYLQVQAAQETADLFFQRVDVVDHAGQDHNREFISTAALSLG
jgi:hypothetical protein